MYQHTYTGITTKYYYHFNFSFFHTQPLPWPFFPCHFFLVVLFPVETDILSRASFLGTCASHLWSLHRALSRPTRSQPACFASCSLLCNLPLLSPPSHVESCMVTCNSSGKPISSRFLPNFYFVSFP